MSNNQQHTKSLKNSLAEVGERIKQIREKYGYNQEDFSKIIGVDQTSMSKIETGKRGLSRSHIINLAKKHKDLNIRWLLLNEGKMLIPEARGDFENNTLNPNTPNGENGDFVVKDTALEPFVKEGDRLLSVKIDLLEVENGELYVIVKRSNTSEYIIGYVHTTKNTNLITVHLPKINEMYSFKNEDVLIFKPFSRTTMHIDSPKKRLKQYSFYV